MASYRIRHYQDQDFEAVRSLFTRGMLEHSPAGYRHVLRSPRVQLQLLALFILVRAAGGSWLLALGSLALALVAIWLLVQSYATAYVRHALGTDMADVRGTYLRSPHTCFWVAEADGAVVGMVAVEPPEDAAERAEALELKRLSVSREHRGSGIGAALCQEVLSFTRARGVGAVVLSTSMVQVPAQRLYERHGFRRVGSTSPSLLAALLCFRVFRYRCDLHGAAKAPPR
ncbi:N-acetyltransferase family 8 member 3-like [Melopsittacus undulatus]|uniref:N-acetyltransferase family 8 member 3-like n=1 Tax=Melopsittacus undulatus TaxID=13146 RepID=UPI00146D58EF|nr:N-acetyltransferase family 8 member 3-like [Melopsittacus undulatus]